MTDRKLEPGHVVEIAGIITILKHEKALRTLIGNSRAILASPTKNGFWRARLESGQIALIHSTAVFEILGQVQIEVIQMDNGAQATAMRPPETWTDTRVFISSWFY